MDLKKEFDGASKPSPMKLNHSKIAMRNGGILNKLNPLNALCDSLNLFEPE